MQQYINRYRIIATTIQGIKVFFCHWKMGSTYYTRVVGDRQDAIHYTDSDIDYVENYLKTNLEKLQIKAYVIESLSYQPIKTKAPKQSNSVEFRGDARHIERYGSIL